MAQGNLSPFGHVSHGQTKTAINWGGIPTITDWWFGTMEFYDFPFSCSYGHLLVITGYKWDYTVYKWGYKYL